MMYPKIPEGAAQPADAEELQKDMNRYTNPNLHRRIEDDAVNKYSFYKRDVYSFVSVDAQDHDEESDTCEIP